MTSDAEKFLGVDGSKRSSTKTGYCWLAAIICPILGPPIGYLALLSGMTPHSEGFGGFGAAYATLLLPIGAGLILSIVLSAISFFRKENMAALSLLGAIPCLLVLAKVILI